MKLALVVAGVAVLAGASGAALANALDKAAVEKIVADYIAANGDKLRASIEAADRAARVIDTRGLITENTPVRGAANAPITIVEFGDYECPFCGRVQNTLEAVAKKYEGKVRFAYKNLPLDFHPNAKPAAMAALAAHKQGKFWEFNDAIWANQDKLGDALYTSLAKSLGLDMAKFEADRTSEAVKAQIATDLQDAAKIGARGTPFFLINGQPVSGALPLEAFAAEIENALAGKQ